MTFATYRSRLIVAVLTAACLAGTGCVSRDKTDLENYAADVLQRPGGRIDPLPPIKPYEAYLYQSGELGLRNPFRSFFDIARTKEKLEPGENDEGQKALLTEMLTHNAEELERAELDSLRMVGILESNDELWGIIRDVEGAVHRVQIGNYMGANFGKILNIQEDRIDLREIIKDAEGRWEERPATLALSEE
ncbi:MAG: type IV pilus assembly protein PilP [Gammaproteobacteria bacterium]|jgi:type IV pilus assembly protein PilP